MATLASLPRYTKRKNKVSRRKKKQKALILTNHLMANKQTHMRKEGIEKKSRNYPQLKNKKFNMPKLNQEENIKKIFHKARLKREVNEYKRASTAM
jgi:Zn-dependent M32 family carboxypeptidase